MSTISELISILKDPLKIRDALAASSPYTLRAAFELDENLQKLAKSKGDARDTVLKELRANKDSAFDDITLASFCYVLEKTGNREDAQELQDVVKRILKTAKHGELSFALYLAVHAAKVLLKAPDVKEALDYRDDEIKALIK